jgi:NADH-quinone oxidoreductase subunit C
MNHEAIVENLQTKFGEAVYDFEEPFGMLTCTTNRETILPLLQHLKESGFIFLTDITGIHLPDNQGAEFGVIYHIHDLQRNIRLRLKVFLALADIHIPTAVSLFASANWMERETFDFYGIIFDGHPKLERILNMEDMNYHPMRKEYPLEDATREDKIDSLFGR